jgi:hypothetical protein
MKKLTSLSAVSVLGFASAINAFASQDVGSHISRMEPSAPVPMVTTSYVPSARGQSSQVSIRAPLTESAKSIADEKPLADELPQNGILTFLAGLAIIVVIGKRRMPS